MNAARQICVAFALFCTTGALLHGCSTAPPKPAVPEAPAVSVGSEIAMRAISLLGAPYKFGGAGPSKFDCSGLVRYIHWELGIDVPRTAAEQFSAAKPITLAALAPGDLLFFRIDGKRISHVAIYAGEGRFIHAPKEGRPIEFRSIEDRFYRPRLAGAGRMF